jgi:predicted O-methyltransferase YrrM
MRMTRLEPYTPEEMFRVFSQEKGSINKHLLIIYSLAVGVNAQRVMDLGVGDTTQALRAAVRVTGGTLFSCDIDRERFAGLLKQADPQWELYLEPSDLFIRRMAPPFDFVLHDAGHEYWQVRQDLRLILPMMRQFGVICVHDTQHGEIGEQMPKAVRDGCKDYQVSWVHLPFSYGLTVLRVEESAHPAVLAPWNNSRGPTTCCWPEPMVPAIQDVRGLQSGRLSWAIWMLRRVRRLLRG